MLVFENAYERLSTVKGSCALCPLLLKHAFFPHSVLGVFPNQCWIYPMFRWTISQVDSCWELWSQLFGPAATSPTRELQNLPKRAFYANLTAFPCVENCAKKNMCIPHVKHRPFKGDVFGLSRPARSPGLWALLASSARA